MHCELLSVVIVTEINNIRLGRCTAVGPKKNYPMKMGEVAVPRNIRHNEEESDDW